MVGISFAQQRDAGTVFQHVLNMVHPTTRKSVRVVLVGNNMISITAYEEGTENVVCRGKLVHKRGKDSGNPTTLLVFKPKNYNDEYVVDEIRFSGNVPASLTA